MTANVAPGRAGAAEALRRDRLAEERLLHGHDAVDRGVDLGVLDQLLDVADLLLDGGDLRLERPDLRVGGVEGLLACRSSRRGAAWARSRSRRAFSSWARTWSRVASVLLLLRLQLLRLEAGDELALLHPLALLEVQPGDAADRLRGDLGLRAGHDVARGRQDGRGLRRRDEGDARRRRPRAAGARRRRCGAREEEDGRRAATQSVATAGQRKRRARGARPASMRRADRSAVLFRGSMRENERQRFHPRDRSNSTTRSERQGFRRGCARRHGRPGTPRGTSRGGAARSGRCRSRRGGRTGPRRAACEMKLRPSALIRVEDPRGSRRRPPRARAPADVQRKATTENGVGATISTPGLSLEIAAQRSARARGASAEVARPHARRRRRGASSTSSGRGTGGRAGRRSPCTRARRLPLGRLEVVRDDREGAPHALHPPEEERRCTRAARASTCAG